MRKVIKSVIYIFLLFSIWLVNAQQLHARPIYDTSKVDLREFDESKIEEFRKDKAFYYEREPTEAANWFEEFMNWLKQFFRFDDILEGPGGKTGRVFMNIIYLIIVLAAVSLIVWGLTRARFRGFISGKGSRVNVEYDVEEEDIHEIEYETELQKAEREKDFRKAIRLRYLETLKKLTDAGWIEWTPHKTNHEYDRELRNTSLLSGFQKVTLIFDYVWYGEFNIDEESYKPFAEQYRLT